MYFYLIISREQYIEEKLIYQYGGTKIFSLYVCGFFDRIVLCVQHTRHTQELSVKIGLVISDPCMSNISRPRTPFWIVGPYFVFDCSFNCLFPCCSDSLFMRGYQSHRISFSAAKSVLVKRWYWPQYQLLKHCQCSLFSPSVTEYILWSVISQGESLSPAVLHGSHGSHLHLSLP